AVHGFAAGNSVAKVFDDVKSQATFSGFRSLLLSWLDWLRVPNYLGVESAAVLWAKRQELVHPTSVIRYPVFVRGKNYSGSSPRITRHPALQRYLREVLAPELARLPEALMVPLGEK